LGELSSHTTKLFYLKIEVLVVGKASK